MTPEDVVQLSRSAAQRIDPFIRRTPVINSEWLAARMSADVSVKLENLQVTGSFKIRGAANKLLDVWSGASEHGVVTASTGNHGVAVAYMALKLRMPCEVWVPEIASSTKVQSLERLGASVIRHGADALEAESNARRYAGSTGRCFVSPYNDTSIIAANATVGFEIASQVNAPLDLAFIAVGGGGLVAGIASALKSIWPDVLIVGCSPEHSPVMVESVKQGNVAVIGVERSLADATSGGIEANTITLPLCNLLVDRWVLVSERQIATALLSFMEMEHQLIEGAAAVPIAAVLAERDLVAGKRVGIVACGANIGLADLVDAAGMTECSG